MEEAGLAAAAAAGVASRKDGVYQGQP